MLIENDSQLVEQLQLITGDCVAEEFMQNLSNYINRLINSDFERLVSLLYRMDVDENKMRNILTDKPGRNASDLIATLIVDRHMQKIRSRKEFRQHTTDDNEERW